MSGRSHVFYSASGELRWGCRIFFFSMLFAILSLAVFQLTLTANTSLFLSIALTYGSLLVATFIMLMYVDRRPFMSVGLALHRRLPAEFLQGLLVGGAMMGAIFLVERLAGFASLQAPPQGTRSALLVLLSGAAWYAVGAFGEELLFRGYIFQTLIEGTNPLAGMLIMSAIFGAAHVANANSSVLGVVNIMLAGAWLSIAYLRTRTLWLPFALHFAWNYLEGTVFSFPVSGGVMAEYSLFRLVQRGPEWLTGGPFGPEGGALATIVLVAGSAFLLFSQWFKRGEGVWILKQRREHETVAA